jgi:hypothetical protein
MDAAGAAGGREASRRMASGRAARGTFFGISALLFAAGAAATIAGCASMPAMGGMPMPGGWTMSMAWMPMPGRTWPGAVAAFVGTWTAMMVAMMLPSVAPALWRYRSRGRPGSGDASASGRAPPGARDGGPAPDEVRGRCASRRAVVAAAAYTPNWRRW